MYYVRSIMVRFAPDRCTDTNKLRGAGWRW